MFGDGIFADVIFADLQNLSVTPPTPVFTTPGDGDMVPLYRDNDDDEVLLILATVT